MPRASEKAVPEKLGRQTPTAAVVLPYTTTHGQEAIDLYNNTGRTAQQWQQLLLYDILAENEDGLWVHITEAGAFLFHGLFYHYFTTTLYTVILVFIYWYLPLPAKPNITKNPHERWIFQHSRRFRL